MAVDANKWLHVPEGVPCIYDVDAASVDEMGPWVRVKRRVLTPKRAATELLVAFEVHPSTRVVGAHKNAMPTNTCFIREVALLPKWMQGRLAVLRIADPDVWIRNVGQRWGSELVGGSPWGSGEGPWKRLNDDGYRWYTLDVGCEGVK